MRIDIEPDPMLPAARALAAEIERKQLTVRVEGGVGYSARRSSAEEIEWFGLYKRAEAAQRKADREAERFARRARRRGEE